MRCGRRQIPVSLVGLNGNLRGGGKCGFFFTAVICCKLSLKRESMPSAARLGAVLSRQLNDPVCIYHQQNVVWRERVMQHCKQGARSETEGWEASDRSRLIECGALKKAHILKQAEAIICLNVSRRCQVHTFIILLIVKDTDETAPASPPFFEPPDKKREDFFPFLFKSKKCSLFCLPVGGEE